MQGLPSQNDDSSVRKRLEIIVCPVNGYPGCAERTLQTSSAQLSRQPALHFPCVNVITVLNIIRSLPAHSNKPQPRVQRDGSGVVNCNR